MSDLSAYYNQNQSQQRSGGCFPVIITLLALAVALGVVIGLFVLVFHPLLEENVAAKQAGVGQRLPRLELVGLTGGATPVTLEELSGKVVLLNFWGVWCPPCRDELPHIVELHAKLRGQSDFRLLAVSCPNGVGESIDSLRQTTQRYLDAKQFDLPTYADPGSVTLMAFDDVAKFGGYPTTVLLDRRSVIRGIWVGFDPRSGQIESIHNKIEQLLAEDSQP